MSAIIHPPGQPISGEFSHGGSAPNYPRLVMATTIVASSLAFIDGSVVNVGLPAIGASLQAEAAGLQWVVNAYLLPLSALLLLGGAAGDRFGLRSVLIGGVSLFGCASLACAAAPNLTILLTARFIQGAGAAFLMPSSLAILGQSFSGEAKGRAVGIWAAAGAAAGAVGPVLGGWLIDAGSWRLAFLINVPLCLTTIVLAKLYVDSDSEETTDALDITGAGLATVSLGLITWALTEGSGRGWTTTAVVLFALGLAFLVAFIVTEGRKGDKAMMPLALFGSASFVGLTGLTLLLYAALGGLFVLLPFILIKVTGYSATQAGAALLPLPLILALASPSAGALASRIGPRWHLVGGPLIVACGFLLMARLDPSADYWTGVLPGIISIAIGMALSVAPLTTAVLVSVDSRHTGAASGLNSAIARTGGLVATALVGATMAATRPDMIPAFHEAAIIGAALCVGAALAAFALVK